MRPHPLRPVCPPRPPRPPHPPAAPAVIAVMIVPLGYPLRLVVPGSVGIRNVKWVGEITTSDVEAVGPWQRGIAYKVLLS